MVASTSSVAGRAALAVGLMIGFYLLAVAIAGGLLFLPYAEYAFAHRVHPKLALVCIVGAGTILWSIVPRRDRFDPPGPRLTRERHPKLFSEIESVAAATGQSMPEEVFLVGDVNAWVAQRGGVMGFWSRRVMGLGLPLLQALSVSELRAVLAHEFGHYHGGDTRLGPWVYKTRSAIERTLQGLAESLLQKPFLWYGRMFLRVSHGVSRRQEFSADALAARVVGSRPLVDGLKKLRVAAAGYDSYWAQEVSPVLREGFLPPIAEGFARFASHEQVRASLDGLLKETLQEEASNPYDTHPALPERIAAVAAIAPGPERPDDPPAVTLLADLPAMEREWLGSVADAGFVSKLRSIGWDSVVESVFLPTWRKAAAEHARVLRGTTLGSLDRLVADADEIGRKLDRAKGGDDGPEARAATVRWLAGAAACAALDRAGWTIAAPPGAPVTARRDGDEIRPFEAVGTLADGSLDGAAWRAEAERLGVAEISLAG